MPELRLVVLALQDRLAYGPTFDAAMDSLFGAGTAAAAAAAASPAPPRRAEGGRTAPARRPCLPAVQSLIDQAARDLADYQRLTAEGKLGEAGQRLESLKRVLEQLKKVATPEPPGGPR